MGYRPRPTRSHQTWCLDGSDHQPEPVETLSGEVVAHVCRVCLVKLRGVRPPGSPAAATWWRPISDDGAPLDLLPIPKSPVRR